MNGAMDVSPGAADQDGVEVVGAATPTAPKLLVWCQAQGFALLVCTLAGGVHVAPCLAAVSKVVAQAVDEAWADLQRRFPRRLYVAGGLNGDFSEVETAWRLDPAEGAWEDLPPMGLRTAGPGVAVVEGKLFVLGGERSGHALRDVRCYDPAVNSWLTIPPMPTGRIRAGAISCGGYLYVVGGLDGSRPLRTVERYDPRTGEWASMPPMHRPRYGCALAAQPGNRLLVFGGELTDAGLAASTELYDPEACAWDLLQAVRPPSCGASIALTASGETAFTFGGLGLNGQALPLAEHLPLGAALAAAVEAAESERVLSPSFVPPMWSPAPPMPTARHLAAVAGWGAGAVVVGGKGPTFEAVRNVDLFVPQAMAWRQLPALPEARLRAGVVSGRF